MGSWDHSGLVDELLDCDLAHLDSAEVCNGSVEEDVGAAEVGKGCLGDSLSEECLEVILEKQFCSELTKESLHEQVAFAISDSNADPAGATDIEARSPNGRGDGLESEGDNVVCLALGEVSRNECGVGEVCLHDDHVEIEGLCLDKKSFLDVSETPLNILPCTGSLSNCGETTEQKDTKIAQGGVAVRVLEVGEVKSEIVGTCCQKVFAKDCEMSSELLNLTAGSPIKHVEEDNDSNSIDDSSGKTLLEALEEKGDANTSSRVLPSPSCGMPVEVLHTAGSPGNIAHHVEQNDRNSVSASSAERISEVVLEKSEVDSCTYILLSQSNHVQQNEQKDRNCDNGGSAVSVMEMREEKDDVLNGPEMETYINRSLVEENSCNFKEGSSVVAFDYAVENSATPHACQPCSIASYGPSKRLDVSDYSGTGAVIAGSNSSITMDSFERMDNVGIDKVDFDSVLEAETPECIFQSSRRSMHRSKSKRETQTEKVAKKCRKPANKVLHSHQTIEILSKASRRKRSCFSKPARSSVWGFLGNISELFEQNNQLDVLEVFKQGSQKARKARGGRRNKRDGSHGGGSSPGSKGKHQAVTSRIRLKIKVGKQVDQSSIKVLASELENTSAPDHQVIGDCRNDEFGEEIPLIRQFHCINKHPEMVEPQPDASYLDAHVADKDLENSVPLYKSSRNDSDDVLGISTTVEVEVEELGEEIENKYLDPGTSPDSEVINQIPDARVGLRVQEDMHDAPMTSSSDLAAPGDVKRLNLPQMGSMKGRKNGKIYGASNCTVNPLCGLGSISKNGLSEKLGLENALNNMSSGKELCRERVPLPKDVELSDSREALTMGCGSEDDLFPIPDLSFGSLESKNVEKFLFPSKTKEHKSSKSFKSSGGSKSKSEVPDIAGSRRGDFCGQKETRRKSVNKSKVKEKGVSDKVLCKVESHPEIGTHVVDAFGGTNMGDKAASDDKCNLDMVPDGALEPYLPPRNAWVSCDECQKWRRIPATLADSIEDTNCKWTCKDNMDKAFADCSTPQEKSNAAINTELDISDASGEEDANGDRYNSKGLERRHSAVSQQSSWTLIKSNLFLHRRRKSQTIDEVMVCHCKSSVHGRSGCGDECLNRMLNIECVKGTCPCGDRCSNQQFQKHNYAKLKCFRCGKKGYGLQLLEDIFKGQFLIEYVGEVLDLHAYEARQMEYASMGHKHFYFMTLNGSEVIDACAKGNLGRFINHSCDPNCRTEKWMVNGEICIGLFAIRDIKKGEELTFDYNYVRVFGAAAKKCVCGSSQCRGYIGGDPLSTEVIVQGDSDEEYPEPVMVLENGETVESLNNVIPKVSAYNDEEMQTEEASKDRNAVDESTGAVGQLEITTENEKSPQRSSLAIPQSQVSSENVGPIGKLHSSIQPVELCLQTEDVTLPTAQQDITTKQETVNKSLSLVPKFETPLISLPGKSISHTYDASKKSQSDKVENNRVSSKSQPLMKTSYSPSSVKKGKHKSNLVSANKSQLLPKPKKLLQGADNGRYEAVEEKLNELLDADGGISKRKDASKGYLKLLLLTAASGDGGNGEAIQSNRNLSLILDALLKTKSRMVLVDIINKNGLRMLHNIMKQSRKEYNKTPILRKLLKVLEYMAAKEILTLEHINGGPPCPGMESFRESMLTLTEHNNKQVHQIARNFRDRWIPRPTRKYGCMERDDGRMEYYKGSNCNRFSASNNYWHDQGVRATEPIDCTKQSVVATTSVAKTQEECSSPSGGHCSINRTKIRKRKSRWDEPAETNADFLSPQHKEQKVQPSSLHNQDSSSQLEMGEVVHDASDRVDDVGQTMHEDVPPGFSYPLNTRLVSPATSIELPGESVGHSKCPFEMVTGNPQEKFISCLPVSYGIPLSILQQTGIPEAESVDSWTNAPGIAFHPFPPLPSYPRNRRNPSPCSVKPLTMNQAGNVQRSSCGSATYHIDQSSPSTSGAGQTDVNVAGTHNQYRFDRARGCSNDLGKRFKQQKWNNSKLASPRLRNRNGWGGIGNNSRNGMCNVGMGSVTNELKNPCCSEDVSSRLQNSGNTFYQ